MVAQFKCRGQIQQLFVYTIRGNRVNEKRLRDQEKFHYDVPNRTVASNNKVNNVTIENIAPDTWVREVRGACPGQGIENIAPDTLVRLG